MLPQLGLMRTERFNRYYGVLTDMYSSHALFWELVILLRRTALVACAVFLTDFRVTMLSSVGSAVSWESFAFAPLYVRETIRSIVHQATLVNMATVATHYWVWPFRNHADNLSELISLIALVSTSLTHSLLVSRLLSLVSLPIFFPLRPFVLQVHEQSRLPAFCVQCT